MSQNKRENQNNNVSIGGQAVIEGVMMRGTSSMATAVRDEDGIIRIESQRIKPQKERNLFLGYLLFVVSCRLFLHFSLERKS